MPNLSSFILLLVGTALGDSPGHVSVQRERVDLIELNHFIDDEGREVFRQVIFYDWSRQHHRFHVRGWRLIKDDTQLPLRRWNPAQYQCSWHDEGRMRQVWAPHLRETWSQRDPERVNRDWLPEDQRLPLFSPAVPIPSP